MVERFFKGGANSESTADGVMLLSGPPGCGKTSLMFQYALNLLSSHSDSHSYVVFLCLRPRLHSHPPLLSQGLDPSSEIFGRIHLKYLDDCPDVALHNYFAAFHLLSPAPLAVLVHDFSHFFHHSQCQQRFNNARGKDLAMVRVLALSHSALLHANKTSPCQLLFSDTHHGDSPKFFIYKTWLSSIYTIQADGSGSFLLRNTFHIKGDVKGHKTARYTISLQHLVLEGLLPDEHL